MSLASRSCSCAVLQQNQSHPASSSQRPSRGDLCAVPASSSPRPSSGDLCAGSSGTLFKCRRCMLNDATFRARDYPMQLRITTVDHRERARRGGTDCFACWLIYHASALHVQVSSRGASFRMYLLHLDNGLSCSRSARAAARHVQVRSMGESFRMYLLHLDNGLSCSSSARAGAQHGRIVQDVSSASGQLPRLLASRTLRTQQLLPQFSSFPPSSPLSSRAKSVGPVRSCPPTAAALPELKE